LTLFSPLDRRFLCQRGRRCDARDNADRKHGKSPACVRNSECEIAPHLMRNILGGDVKRSFLRATESSTVSDETQFREGCFTVLETRFTNSIPGGSTPARGIPRGCAYSKRYPNSGSDVSKRVGAISVPLVPTAAVSAHVVACDRGACPHKAHLRDDSSALRSAARLAVLESYCFNSCTAHMRRLSGSAEDCGGKRTSDHRDAFEPPRNTLAHTRRFSFRNLPSFRISQREKRPAQS